MDLKNFLISVVFLITAILIFKTRKWWKVNKKNYKYVGEAQSDLRKLKFWSIFIICIICFFLYLLKSLS